MTRIQLKDIHKRLGGKHVLQGISIDIGPGDIVAFVGPSGCGKTTLFKCILGELTPDRGQVLFNGQDVTYQRVERRKVGIVYQDYALFPHMTVAQNVAYGMRVQGLPEERIRKRVEELLELVRLPDKAESLPTRLSGGEQQRVALARVLAVEPRVLLLDEAFTALDATTRSELVHQMLKIIQRLRLTTLLVTHDQEEAFLFARHVVVLDEGRIVASGSPDTVMKSAHPFVQDFVKMLAFHKALVFQDPSGQRFVQLKSGARIPVALQSVNVGDEVHVMVKKGPERESFEVWPLEKT